MRASTDWTLRGIHALLLDNGLVRIVVLPELGGKSWELQYLISSTDHGGWPIL